MVLALFDIGNTHTHVGLANTSRVFRHLDLSTPLWRGFSWGKKAAAFFAKQNIQRAVFCSVVPAITPKVVQFIRNSLGVPQIELKPGSIRGVGIDYPAPNSIGADRLANAVAVRHHFGAPAVVVDFGTAVTFDVVDRNANYVGGIIAPGLAMMTDYLHEKTALLPRVVIREVSEIVGKSTQQAMLIGAVHGYRGLVRELIKELKKELRCPRLPVVATGGYAKLIAAGLKEITAVDPLLTLEGLRLVGEAHGREGGLRP
jgi:type III pantothenate kinase